MMGSPGVRRRFTRGIAGAGITLLLGLPEAVGTRAADADLVVGAAIGAIQPLRGINIGPLGNRTYPALTTAYQQIGVNLIRTHDFGGPLDMSTMYPDRTRNPSLSSSFNFTGSVGFEFRSSDTVYRSIVDNGFEPFLRIGDSAGFVQVPTAVERANWAQAALQVVRHYRDGQWNGFVSTVRYAEIWNEPNNQPFWPSPNTNADYYQLYIETSRVLKSAVPALSVGGPGVGPSGCRNASVGQVWVRGFLDAVRAASAPLDFFSWHLYSNNPDEFTTCAAFFRSELDSRGFTNTVQIVSEWNTDTGSVSAADADDLRANARGAAINTASWINMQAAGVAQETFYRGPEAAQDDGVFYGMFRSSGVSKKVGYAAQLWNALTQYSTRRSISGGASNFYAIAGSNDAGQTAVLVANTSNSTRTWTLSGTGATFTVQTVSDTADGVVATTSAAATFSIPPYGVQLVIASPPVSNPFMALDGPVDDSTVTQPFITGGWAVDLGSANGAGVDAIHVWAFPIVNGAIGAGQFVDAAILGGFRPDVGAVFGSQFDNAGFNFLMTGLSPGTYYIGVYGHSSVTGTFNQQRFARVTIR